MNCLTLMILFYIDAIVIAVSNILFSDIDDCVGALCKSGTCIDEVNGYSCQCQAGYTGEFCEEGKNKIKDKKIE